VVSLTGSCVLWQIEDDARLIFESLKPGKDRASASAVCGLRNDVVEDKCEVVLNGHPLSLVIRFGNERETTDGVVRLAVFNQDVALLFDPRSPPLGLLLRLARNLNQSNWPMAVLSGDAMHLCPKVFVKPVKDDSLCVLAEDESREVEERAVELSNVMLSAAAVLYSHGYREANLNTWISQSAPQTTAVSGFVFCAFQHGVTLWGDYPTEVLSRLETEVNKPFEVLFVCLYFGSSLAESLLLLQGVMRDVV
jgi:hypothetical protein